MEPSVPLRARAKHSTIAPLLSLVVPGSGQVYLKRTWRGITILLAALILAYLIPWGFDNLDIGKFTLGSVTTTWLWIPFVFFALWNIYDAYRLARGEVSPSWVGFLLAGAMLYYVAWNVTDINLDRLVTKFHDATVIMGELVHPDLITTDPVTGAMIPSDNFGDIFGRLVATPAPNWLVNLGVAKAEQTVTTYRPGTLVETIAIGLLATIFSTFLAIPVSFFAAHNIMSRVPLGNVVYYVARSLLNIVRAVDTIIWGLIVVVWVGLGDFAGIIALTIHSIAALAKLYSEEIEHIDMGPVEAITASGGNLVQTIRYAVIPQIVPPFLSYTLLRWDINMRSATVVGFVAGGGIGFFVLETIRKGAYTQYAAALWAIAIVIVLVDYISGTLSHRIRAGETRVEEAAPQAFYRSPRTLALLLMGFAVFYYCWYITGINLRDLFAPAPTFIKLVRDFLAIDMSPDLLDTILKQLIITLFQALLATTLGAIVAIPFSFLAARNLTGRSRLSIWIFYVTRWLFDILRSIEALLYVAIFVFWVGIGPFAGTLALAITSFALVGKLYADAIENIDTGPMEAILATGANRLQAIVYAILPQIIPPFVSYSIYQWDINVRMATIIGFAGGGGIGLLLNGYFGELQYHKAGMVVALVVIVVAALDFASAKIREQMV
jgi:phosphonate ABC transporter permease subunit PhnE